MTSVASEYEQAPLKQLESTGSISNDTLLNIDEASIQEDAAEPLPNDNELRRFCCKFPDCVDRDGNPKSYKHESFVEAHMALAHTRSNRPTIDCEYKECSRRGRNGFFQKDDYRGHLQSCHLWSFAWPSTLERQHMPASVAATNLDELPHQASVQPEEPIGRTTDVSATHEQRPYKCQTPGCKDVDEKEYSFAFVRDLEKHICEKHTPEKVPTRGQPGLFPTPDRYRFRCEFPGCVDQDGNPKRFTREEHLRRHLLTVHHTRGYARIDCEYKECSRRGLYGFHLAKDYKGHLQDYHNEGPSKEPT